MATYSTVKYGAKGDSVRKLQSALNSAGYNLNVDGIYGDKTLAAVKQYQQAQGLTVDGIVGKNTWGSLGYVDAQSSAPLATTPTSSAAPTVPTTAPDTASALAQYEANKPTYAPSQAVTDAQNALAQWEASKPGAYTSSYADQLDALYNQIIGRGEFSYDPKADPLYDTYKDNYTKSGQLAMQDTMANLASLTGGYGNTYAQTAGQQQYNEYMTALSNILPQLEERAYGRWQDEGAQMYNQFALTQGRDQADYGRYRDTVGDYYNDLGYAYGKYQDTYANEYNQYLNDLSSWQTDRSYYYGKDQDALAQQNYLQELALAQQNAKKSGGSSSKSSSSSSSNAELSQTDLDSIAFRLQEKYGDWASFQGATDINAMGLTNTQKQYVYDVLAEIAEDEQKKQPGYKASMFEPFK